MPRINLVIVGHKDHGKSTLIGRLLYDSKAIQPQKLEEIKKELKRSGKKFEFAFLMDSLEEERKGGLTIDIMHTPFKSKKYFYTIIDCPGHREFIEKMLTGASKADAAVLVVSTKEGIQDQTRQHAFLINTLGIKQLVVVVNKFDTVDYQEHRFQRTTEELKPILKRLGYEAINIIPISAMKGDNVFVQSEKMPWYNGPTLIEALDENIIPRTMPIKKPLRGLIQDIYPHENDQKIIASKIVTGTLKAGSTIIFNPSGKKALLKKILIFGAEVKRANPNESVGLILDKNIGVKRGEVLSYPENQPPKVKTFEAKLILFSSLQIKNGDVLKIRYGTAEKKCRVKKILAEIDPVNLTVNSKFPEILGSETMGELELQPLDPMSLQTYSDFPELGRFVIEGKKGTAGAGIILKIKN
jgi:elongation factor 1-alpha